MMPYNHVSQRMVPRPILSVSENCQTCILLSLTPDLLNQKVQGSRRAAICVLISPSSNYDTQLKFEHHCVIRLHAIQISLLMDFIMLPLLSLPWPLWPSCSHMNILNPLLLQCLCTCRSLSPGYSHRWLYPNLRSFLRCHPHR